MYHLVVIGAGAIGLSVARYFQIERAWQCLLVEKEARIGQGISSRNSEVIHAGLYYPANSLKARLCVEGKPKLYDYLERNSLPFRRCGKYVVAPPEQEAYLRQLFKQARTNGVDDLSMLTRNELIRQYDGLAPHPALFSPSTGIMSVDRWMHHLSGEFQAAGGDLALQTRFIAMAPRGDGFGLWMVDASGDTVSIAAERVVNATGLSALEVARQAGFDYEAKDHRLRYCKGSYFKVPGARGTFQHLIYPLPTSNSLGIHVRLDLLGEVGLGPDVEYLDRPVLDYTVNPALQEEFRRQVREFWPAVDQYRLEPDWAGVRPHLFVGGSYHQDFYITAEHDEGYPGWVNLFGIDSPGLTAAMAFGPYIDSLWNCL